MTLHERPTTGLTLALTTGLLACAAAIRPAGAQVPMGGSSAALPTTLATIAASGAAQTLSFAAAGNAAYDITLTANAALTLSGGTTGQFQSMTLLLRESGSGGFVPVLPSSIQWASGATPTFNTQSGAVNTVVLCTSDGGKTIAGTAGGVPIGTVAGTARDAAAAITAETAASTAAASETTRAEAAEAGLLPKAGTTLAGLSVSASPTAAQLAAALPAFSATAQGLVPAPPSGSSNMVLGQSGWAMATGGGNVSTDAAGTISAQVVRAAAGSVNRTLSARASDIFNVRDFGAVGNNSGTTIGTTYGSTLAAVAAYTTAAGVTPFTWATNPLFGLTFTMTTTSAQSTAGTTLNFAYTSTFQVGSASIAPWQDPNNGNFLLRPGMQVTGSCIAAGTTVSAIPSTIVRQGELLPGATDWAPSTAYAVGAEVFANGNFYQATTAGTSAGSGGPSGTGTGITDGAAAWSYLKPSESTNLPSGAVTLSAATSSACASGAAITFTIAPAQLQALTLDWLGIQTAVAQAYAAPAGAGGQVYIPAGLYQLNHSVMNPGGTTNTAAGVPSVSMFGDGRMLSQLQFPADLGQDECAIGESTRNAGYVNSNTYADFRLFGPGNYTATPGVSPNKMDGLCMGQSDFAYRLNIGNMHGGINIERDHQVIRDVSSTSNGYGIFFAPYAPSIGNQEINGGALFGLVAGIGVTSTNQFDSSLMANVHTGFGPYGFYSLPSTPNVTATAGGVVTDSVLDGVWTEQVGAAWMKGSQTYSNFSNNVIIAIGGGMANDNFSIGNGLGGTVQPRAEIDVYNFNGNTMVGTQMAPYSVVSTAAVLAANSCSGNHWENDQNFVLGISGTSNVPTAAVPPLQCASGGSGNDVTLPNAHYIFNSVYSYGANTFVNNTGVPVQPAGNSGDTFVPYQDGQAAVGITALQCPEGGGHFCPIQVSGLTTIKGNGSQINPGPVMASAMGFSGPPGVVQALDATNALGTATYSCTTSCQVQLGNFGGGQSVATGQTAGTSAAPFAIGRRVVQFTTVASGGAATLPTAGTLGDSVTIFNDGANALSLSIPSSGTFQPGGSQTATLAAGSSVTYRRTGLTTWR